MPWVLPDPVPSLLGTSPAFVAAYLEAYEGWAGFGSVARFVSGQWIRGPVIGGGPAKGPASPPPEPGATDEEQGRVRGTADARGESRWLGIGILLPGISLFMPWTMAVSVPEYALLGRSPQYLAGYLRGYTSRVRSGSFLWAAAGCGIDIVVIGGIAGLVTAAQAAEACLSNPFSVCMPDLGGVFEGCLGTLVLPIAGACFSMPSDPALFLPEEAPHASLTDR
jgi:hypothetical protein